MQCHNMNKHISATSCLTALHASCLQASKRRCTASPLWRVARRNVVQARWLRPAFRRQCRREPQSARVPVRMPQPLGCHIGVSLPRTRPGGSSTRRFGIRRTIQEPRSKLPLDVGYYLNLVLPRKEEPPKKNTSHVNYPHGRLQK